MVTYCIFDTYRRGSAEGYAVSPDPFLSPPPPLLRMRMKKIGKGSGNETSSSLSLTIIGPGRHIAGVALVVQVLCIPSKLSIVVNAYRVGVHKSRGPQMAVCVHTRNRDKSNFILLSFPCFFGKKWLFGGSRRHRSSY